MSKVKVKICGLSRSEDIECVNKLAPDFIGFVFFAKSKRAVSSGQAARLKAQLAPGIKAVGVFVNAELEFIAGLVQAGTIDIVQLHGDENADYCRRLRERVSAPLIKAVRVRGEKSFIGLEEYPVDYLLFDTYEPGLYGGTGKRFDLRFGDDKRICRPYFVAGGLDADNVADVLRETHAFAVDVSGGVETDGLKDPQKIAAFIANVRGDIK